MKILAINPWIFDFAAYDFWLKPYGFLQLITYLRAKGNNIDWVDCLDRADPSVFSYSPSSNHYGCGKFYSETIKAPDILCKIPRRYKKYGMKEKDFFNKITRKKYDAILVTSGMTYWYQGVRYLLNLLNEHEISAPFIFLGGTYVNLCSRHAQVIFPECRIVSSFNLDVFFAQLNIPFRKQEFRETLPDYTSFYRKIPYVVFRTSYGCPFECAYCGIHNIELDFFRIAQERILEYLNFYYQRGVRNFTFYDDALLFQVEYIKELLERILRLGIKVQFHTPNGLHVHFLDSDITKLMKQAGFINPHLSIETLTDSLDGIWQQKFRVHEPFRALDFLKRSGYKNGEFTVYLLFGWPGQNFEKLRADIFTLHNYGARVSLSEFSPINGTRYFDELRRQACYDIDEPLFQNNSLFPFYPVERWGEFFKLKNEVRALNQKFDR